jgi:hypothetical protein
MMDSLMLCLVIKFHKLWNSGRAEVSPLLYNAVIMKTLNKGFIR